MLGGVPDLQGNETIILITMMIMMMVMMMMMMMMLIMILTIFIFILILILTLLILIGAFVSRAPPVRYGRSLNIYSGLKGSSRPWGFELLHAYVSWEQCWIHYG